MIVGSLHLHGRQHGENLFAAVSHKCGRMSLVAIQVCAAITAAVAVQQLLQQDAAHLMHGRTDGHFAGFQVQVAKPMTIL